jgi:hypothetical protein
MAPTGLNISLSPISYHKLNLISINEINIDRRGKNDRMQPFPRRFFATDGTQMNTDGKR